ncbi:hypothetical protein ACEPPN_015938 [Leptodophora sp. 'Broadleaf-Isolate-01']
MPTLSNNIRSIDDCCIDLFDKEYCNFFQMDYDSSPQLSSSMDINSWNFSPLPSPESPYFDRQLSSTYQDRSWDTSDQTFDSLMTPDSMNNEFATSEEFSSAAYQNAFNNTAESQRVEQWSIAPLHPHYVPESQTTAGVPDICSPSLHSHASSPPAVQPSQGKPLSCRRSSRNSPRLSKQSKPRSREVDIRTPKAKNSTHQRWSSTSTLQNMNSRPLTTSTPPQGATSPPKHIRLNHNQVEKQYRNRLNGQFETLLLALPREAGDGDGDGGEEKKVSKAEVLVLAMKHIRDLERDRRRLEEENEKLEHVMEELTERWVESGGVVLP